MAKKKETQQERTKRLKLAMIKAMEASLGIVTHAAEKAGINRRTHQLWMKDDEEYREAIMNVDEIAKDFVDSQMYKRIKAGSDKMIIHYQNNRMRDRGYGEKLDITSDGEKIDNTIKVIFEDFSDKEDE